MCTQITSQHCWQLFLLTSMISSSGNKLVILDQFYPFSAATRTYNNDNNNNDDENTTKQQIIPIASPYQTLTPKDVREPLLLLLLVTLFLGEEKEGCNGWSYNHFLCCVLQFPPYFTAFHFCLCTKKQNFINICDDVSQSQKSHDRKTRHNSE